MRLAPVALAKTSSTTMGESQEGMVDPVAVAAEHQPNSKVVMDQTTEKRPSARMDTLLQAEEVVAREESIGLTMGVEVVRAV
jgi:hypothetical protein